MAQTTAATAAACKSADATATSRSCSTRLGTTPPFFRSYTSHSLRSHSAALPARTSASVTAPTSAGRGAFRRFASSTTAPTASAPATGPT